MLVPNEDTHTTPWSRRRRNGIDKRTRAARRWAELRDIYVGELGREPTPREDVLLDGLCDVSLERDALRMRRTARDRAVGERAARTVLELTHEWRRLRRLLGLDQPDAGDETLEQLMGIR